MLRAELPHAEVICVVDVVVERILGAAGIAVAGATVDGSRLAVRVANCVAGAIAGTGAAAMNAALGAVNSLHFVDNDHVYPRGRIK